MWLARRRLPAVLMPAIPGGVDLDHPGQDTLCRRPAGVANWVLGGHPHPMRTAPADAVADRVANDQARTTASDLTHSQPGLGPCSACFSAKSVSAAQGSSVPSSSSSRAASSLVFALTFVLRASMTAPGNHQDGTHVTVTDQPEFARAILASCAASSSHLPIPEALFTVNPRPEGKTAVLASIRPGQSVRSKAMGSCWTCSTAAASAQSKSSAAKTASTHRGVTITDAGRARLAAA